MTWKPGDLALCIKMGVWRGSATGRPTPGPVPKPGCVYTVSWVGVLRDGALYLELKEVPTPINSLRLPIPWRASRFKKLPPLTDEERDEFLTDLEFDLDVAHLQRQYEKGVAS